MFKLISLAVLGVVAFAQITPIPGGGGGGGGATSVTAGASGALVISPTTGAVVADVDTAYVPNKAGAETIIGDWTFYDTTAVTGSTLLTVRAGAGQSGNLQSWQNNGGGDIANVNSSGAMLANDFYNKNDSWYQTGTNVLQGSNVVVKWSSTTSQGGTADAGLARNAAGIVEVNNGTAGTLRDLKLRNITVMDTTAVTGSTLAVIQAGAGQSGNLLSVRNNSGTEIGSVDGSGNATFVSVNNGTGTVRIGSNQLGLSNSKYLAWSSGSGGGGSFDTAMYRNAAGVIEINNGTAGTYRDLLLRRSQHNGVTVASLPAAAAGNAGSIQYVTDANATTIGSTVAGGGSNKVMVWSDGTNWKIYAN